MRLLAGTYAPQELNRAAFGLYADFRPSVEGWGKKGEVRCEEILALRKKGDAGRVGGAHSAPVVTPGQPDAQGPEAKKPRAEMSVEEYEAALDAEGYDDLFVKAGA